VFAPKSKAVLPIPNATLLCSIAIEFMSGLLTHGSAHAIPVYADGHFSHTLKSLAKKKTGVTKISKVLKRTIGATAVKAHQFGVSLDTQV
jgi:hypothetical protein